MSLKLLMRCPLSLTAALVVVAVTTAQQQQQRDAGILYGVWHSTAATNMNTIRTKYPNAPLLTTELVIQSAGAYTLNDVLAKYNISGDIWNVQPETGDDDGGGGGFYCLYSHRPGDPLPAPLPDCVNRTATATRHAKMLAEEANFSYIVADWTNWAIADVQGKTDIAILRPTENLFQEWRALRDAGIPTPLISVWPCSPKGSDTWQWALDRFYNNDTYADMVYRQNGKMVMFIPYNPTCYDSSVVSQIESNGGLNNVVVIPMWALFGAPVFEEGVYGFFSPCRDIINGTFTTSMVGDNIGSCNQYPTYANTSGGPLIEISASGSYMLSQGALPFASPGHLRGLTVARLFEQVLQVSPPHLFVSGFNAHIGGRQAPNSKAKIAFNMGLPHDPQKDVVWVDSYASEFSRDIEPSVEGGNTTWIVASSCVRMYMSGRKCSDGNASTTEPCCTRADKEIFGNIWSLHRNDGGDYLLTQVLEERNALIASGFWTEQCNPIPHPTAFCLNMSEPDGRNGPFMLYNTSNTGGDVFATIPLYRCITTNNVTDQQHFFSTNSTCEGNNNKMERILGYIATTPGREMLRGLRRCLGSGSGTRFHALDLPCDTPDGDGQVLGYVR